MNAIVVDDVKLSTVIMVKILEKIPEIKSVQAFTDSLEAYEYVKENHIDIAFLDIEMPAKNGFDLTKMLKEYNPYVYIIFVTGYSNYSVDAFKEKVGGYLLKPVHEEDVIKEVNYAIVNHNFGSKNKLVAQTFGNFELFADGKIVKFGRSKSKEVLAYLIDRNGASATSGELIGILWEDKFVDQNIKSMYQNIISDMMSSLKAVNADDVIIKSKNNIAIDVTKIGCDYFDFLNGSKEAMRKYRREYMLQYSWAEYTTAYLDSVIDKDL